MVMSVIADEEAMNALKNPFLESWCALGARRVAANVTPRVGL
tara:strand:- start:189 stop:314 length:126 start_codon:yes stop_codon:yes gene_type:complete